MSVLTVRVTSDSYNILVRELCLFLCVQVVYEMCLPFYTFAAIPVFPRPSVNDSPINPINSPLQFNGTGKY